MKTSTLFKIFFLLSSMFACTLATAQDTTAETGNTTLEEVLVTATRRGESDIMSTPLAMTALSGEEMKKFAIRDLNDIALSVPGLSSGTVSAFKSAQFAMRGVTETTIIVYKESPVGVTLDEFVVPHIQTSNLEMFDIEAIEVLRGPQGTLFGKNTTGGVINVRTKRPVLAENSVELRATLGDFGTRKGNFALNFAAGDTIAFRFAGMYLKSDGYYKNGAPYGPIGTVVPFNSVHVGESGFGDGSDLGGDDVFSARVKMLWSPNDDVNLLFQYEIVRDNGDTPPIVAESAPGYLYPLWGFPAATTTRDPLDQAGNSQRDDLFLKMNGGHQVDINGFYLNGDVAINDDYTIFFNAGYRDQKSRLPSSYTGASGPISLFDATRDDDRETSQIEVRLGSNLDGPFNYTIGAFYQNDDTDFCVLQVIGMLDGFFVGTPPDFWNNNPRILCNTQRADAKAIYADGTWNVNDRFHITAGIRYTDEQKAWAGRPMRLALDGIPLLDILNEPIEAADFDRFPEGVVRNKKSWQEPTYRLIFGYDLSDDLFGFIGYSRGFKSGGYNDQLGTTLDPITDLSAAPTEPEIADSFEAGIKATFADGAATISINAYYVEYTNAQRTFNVSFPGGGQETLFFNAAEMTVKGVEAEGAWAVNDAFTLRYNIAYMDAKFDSFQADTNFDGIIDVDLSGNPVTRAPEWMGSINGTYTHSIADRGDLEWNLRFSYEDDSVSSYSDVAPEFNTLLNSKSLFDASVTFRDAQDRYYLKVLGSNLTDERYRTGSLSVGVLWIMTAYGPPRYFGVEFGTRFNF